MATLQEQGDNDRKLSGEESHANDEGSDMVSESPGLRIVQKVSDEDQPAGDYQQERESAGADVQKEGAPRVSPEVTRETGAVKVTSSVEEDPPSKSGVSSLVEKVKDKMDHAGDKVKGRQDEQDPNPELAYETAAVSESKPGFFSKVKDTIWKGGKSDKGAAANTKENNTLSSTDSDKEVKTSEKATADEKPSGVEEKTLETNTGTVEDIKAPGLLDRSKEEAEAVAQQLGEKLNINSTPESAASKETAANHQDQQPGFLNRMAQKIGLSSPKS